jgi:hypothetical protein
MSEYHNAIFDTTLAFTAVIEKLAFVLFFFRYWGAWMAKQGRARKHWLPSQTLRDIETSVCAIISLIAVWADFKLCRFPPDLIRLVRFSSFDCQSLTICSSFSVQQATEIIEQCFSNMGSWMVNRHVLGIADAVIAICNRAIIAKIDSKGEVVIPRRSGVKTKTSKCFRA